MTISHIAQDAVALGKVTNQNPHRNSSGVIASCVLHRLGLGGRNGGRIGPILPKPRDGRGANAECNMPHEKKGAPVSAIAADADAGAAADCCCYKSQVWLLRYVDCLVDVGTPSELQHLTMHLQSNRCPHM